MSATLVPCRSQTFENSREDTDVVEIPLLLPGWQMSALEKAANIRGLTAGEMVRQLLREFIATQRRDTV